MPKFLDEKCSRPKLRILFLSFIFLAKYSHKDYFNLQIHFTPKSKPTFLDEIVWSHKKIFCFSLYKMSDCEMRSVSGYWRFNWNFIRWFLVIFFHAEKIHVM
jgi:hypothetical protein